MKHLMFDIDGTLTQSYEFDEACYLEAVYEVIGININNNWADYPYVTDRGILKTVIEDYGLPHSLLELEEIVKNVFVNKVKLSIANEPVKEIQGAKRFISYLNERKDCRVSFATGGWYETAKLKLESAGFNTDKLYIASSNDHFSRVEIMKKAREMVDSENRMPVTYFGDALWDVKACEELGFELIIVGNRVDHKQQILDFSYVDDVVKIFD